MPVPIFKFVVTAAAVFRAQHEARRIHDGGEGDGQLHRAETVEVERVDRYAVEPRGRVPRFLAQFTQRGLRRRLAGLGAAMHVLPAAGAAGAVRALKGQHAPCAAHAAEHHHVHDPRNDPGHGRGA